MVLADNLAEALRAQQIGQRPRRLRFKQRAHLRLIWATGCRYQREMNLGSAGFTARMPGSLLSRRSDQAWRNLLRPPNTSSNVARSAMSTSAIEAVMPRRASEVTPWPEAAGSMPQGTMPR